MDLTRTRQRAYTDKNMNAKVASALHTMGEVITQVAEGETYDLTDILDSVRMNPDVACAWVLAGLVMLGDGYATKVRLNEMAAAIKRYTPPETTTEQYLSNVEKYVAQIDKDKCPVCKAGVTNPDLGMCQECWESYETFTDKLTKRVHGEATNDNQE